MSEGTIATLFSPYGLLKRCKIVVDLQTLRSRGYGFVKYDNAISAERALTDTLIITDTITSSILL